MKEKLKQSITIVAIPLILIFGTIAIYFLGKGYRFDILNGEIEKTGVISVKTQPKKATLYIDDEVVGKTPKAVGWLKEGLHTIEIEKDGYFAWSHEVTVRSEQLIPLKVALFLEDPTVEDLFPAPQDEEDETDSEEISTESTPATTDDRTTDIVREMYVDANSKITIFTVTNPSSRSEDAESTDSADSELTPSNTTILQVWAYSAERKFWELNLSPHIIAEFDLASLSFEPEQFPEIEMIISPNAQKVLVQMTSKGMTQCYLLDTNRFNNTPQELTQLKQHDEIAPTWSLDSLHIIFSKNNELRSFNTETFSQVVITEKDDQESFAWTTNLSGQLFLFAKEEDVCNIVRADPNGSNKTTIIQFPRKDGTRVLFNETSDDNSSEADPNLKPNLEDNTSIDSPTCNVQYMYLTPNEEQILLFSEKNIVTYSLDDDEAEVYPADAPRFISFSPDEEKFAYIDENGAYLKEFRFILEEGDPLHTIGPNELMPISADGSYSNFVWHPKSRNILFTKNTVDEDESTDAETSVINAIDTENKQLFTISLAISSPAISEKPFAVDGSGKYLIALCGDTACKIIISE